VRVDSGVEAGAEILPLYDPMVAKLVVHAPDREQARMRMLRALEEFEIGGVTTLLGFHRALLEHPCFVAAGTCRGVVESEELATRAAELSPAFAAAPAADGRATIARDRLVEVASRRFSVRVREPEPPWRELARARAERGRAGGTGGGGRDAVVTPMQGTVLAVEVAEGDAVTAGQVLAVIEAMKMENEVHAHRDGVVRELSVAAGETVSTGQVVCVVVDE
jgi:acetyl-CoA/propionyl-CoA carboxylase biotin carboxyl carrier protein